MKGRQEFVGGFESGMQVAILAGGLATRLGDLTRNRPKSIIEIAGKPFLTYQLNFLRQADVAEVVLCIEHLGEQTICDRCSESH